MQEGDDTVDFKLKELGHDEFAFHLEDEGRNVGEITWTEMSDIMVVEYTFVEETLRNHGLAKKLLDRAAEYAREKGFKIEPVCSYAAVAFDRYEEYNDVKM